ncbi:sterol O-acyltransferase 1-like [Diabrotica undecimpunctata]|uniref:sterol O-acyltransferase 1-like n=1 Tax=Diabrotica undecimpunctata TaxID=50387 RepID=UPI003B633F64
MSPNSKNSITQNGHYNKQMNGNVKQKEYKALQEKQFEARDSLIEELCNNVPHIASIQNFFIATIFCLFTSILANDYMVKGEFSLGFHLIRDSFAKLHISAFFWVLFLIVTCTVHIVFKFWALVRVKLIPNYTAVKIWDRIWIVLVFAFHLMSFIISSFITEHYDLPVACSSIILLEQTRLSMKIHAYIRHNAERVVKYKPHSDQELILPKFKNYLYFLFAPTIVYRDEYPRTTNIRWDFVAFRFLEIIGVIIYQCFILHRFVFPAYREFGLRKFTWGEVIIPIIENSLPGLLLLLSGFYQVLHSVQNLFAEILRFADRQFYKNWWNCVTTEEFFRTWNCVVHDWLYTYVYRDIHILTKGNKVLGKLAVFVLSAIIHEWVLAYQFKFYTPVILYCYLIAAVISMFRVPKIKCVNILFWYGMMFGSGLMASLYTLEYYARTNNPASEYTFKYWFLPRWYLCDCIA